VALETLAQEDDLEVHPDDLARQQRLQLQWWCPTCQEPAALHDEAATLA